MSSTRRSVEEEGEFPSWFARGPPFINFRLRPLVRAAACCILTARSRRENILCSHPTAPPSPACVASQREARLVVCECSPTAGSFCQSLPQQTNPTASPPRRRRTADSNSNNNNSLLCSSVCCVCVRVNPGTGTRPESLDDWIDEIAPCRSRTGPVNFASHHITSPILASSTVEEQTPPPNTHEQTNKTKHTKVLAAPKPPSS